MLDFKSEKAKREVKSKEEEMTKKDIFVFVSIINSYSCRPIKQEIAETQRLFSL